MATETLELIAERLTALEQEVTRVKARIEPQNTPQLNSWLDDVYGAFKDDPLFEKAVEYGREWRASQDSIADEDADVPDRHG